MNNPSPTFIVVGVDGSHGSASALRHAIREARRLGAHLRLVHVLPTFNYRAPTPVMVLPPSDLEETGRSYLEAATRQVEAEAPELTPEAVMRRGPRSSELAKAAEDAVLLVVGRDSRPTLERLFLGNTAAGVACRALCPVESVPPDWEAVTQRGVVVAGIKSTTHAGGVLADAFSVASQLGARLVVLHAWKLDSGYDDIVASRTSVQEWNDRSARELGDLVAGWRESYPDVDVEIRVEHAHPADSLVRAATDADLLVVGRRAHGIPASRHLGSTARAVLRSASCPVRVVPPATSERDLPDLVLEHAGGLDT